MQLTPIMILVYRIALGFSFIVAMFIGEVEV